MPKGTRVHRCVQHMKAKGGGANPYAVCQSATGQSYKTGKALTYKSYGELKGGNWGDVNVKSEKEIRAMFPNRMNLGKDVVPSRALPFRRERMVGDGGDKVV